jgi:hypothetical protein
VIRKLREARKSDEYFENMVRKLTLEELIALKLELSFAKANVAVMGLPLYTNIRRITMQALLYFAVSISDTYRHASASIGMTQNEFKKIVKKYRITKYFDDEYYKYLEEFKEEYKQSVDKGNEVGYDTQTIEEDNNGKQLDGNSNI